MRLHRSALCFIPLAVLAITIGCSRAHQASTSSIAAPQLQNISVVTIDPGPGIEIKPVLAKKGTRKDATFAEIIDRCKPFAAINGTFYSEVYDPLGDIVIDGKQVITGRYPNAIAVRNDGKVEFIRRNGSKFDWRGYKCALAAGPRLIYNGKIHLDLSADGFRPAGLKIEATRSGIGLTKSGKLLLVVANDRITLSEFAKIMQEQGAVEAMNLDGGPACGLYCDGKTIVNPSLQMTNMLVVYKK